MSTTSHELSGREREILDLLATGASNKDIAQKLSITENTVKVHLRNIFPKIGAASRTEAAIYALRETRALTDTETLPVSSPEPKPEFIPAIPLDAKPEPLPAAPRQSPWWIIFLLLAVLSVGIVISFAATRAEATPPAPTAQPAKVSRWEQKTDLPTPRSGLAVAAYEDEIYAIAGQTDSGVTGIVESYRIATDTWQTLPAKPSPVTDVSAAVIGGKIYVPGGRTAADQITAIVEVYDPVQRRWQRCASLPKALSAYALAAFEGKLYIFGGWDGKTDRAEVYEFNPERDQWSAKTPMPTPRSFAGAAVTGGKIYVLGGLSAKVPLRQNEQYLPERDSWLTRNPLPQARYAFGITSIADTIYMVGGLGQGQDIPPSIQYVYQQDQWQEFQSPGLPTWSHLGLVAFQNHFYGLGGLWAGIPATKNLSYQAIYTILLPSIQ